MHAISPNLAAPQRPPLRDLLDIYKKLIEEISNKIKGHIVIYVVIFNIIFLFCAFSVVWANYPDSFIGIWEGVGVQNDNRRWSIRIIFTGESAAIEYPSLGCSGRLEFKESERNTAVFIERIDGRPCISNGTVKLTFIEPELIHYEYRSENNTAIGSLRRTLP